jgi:sec-independent protein translocase protein TatC
MPAKKVLRPVAHDEQLSLVDHLDELRSRLIVCIAALTVLFALCFWQNDAVLDIVNRPVEQTAFKKKGTSKDPLEQAANFQQSLRAQLLANAKLLRSIATDEGISAETRRLAAAAATQAETTAALAPAKAARRPVTLGVGEPFFATFKVAGYASVLLGLPLILWQLYGFILPAFSPTERRVALPMMSMVPFLFYTGVAFAYFVVLPKAIDVLQNFNDDKFDILIQATDLYRFSVMVCIAMGALFQIPVGILLVTRMGIVSVAQLRANRRYAILVIAVLAMLLPGTDPISMGLAMAPLLVLFEGSILLAALLERRSARAEASSSEPD